MPNVSLSSQLYDLDFNVTTGAQARNPIIEMLNLINESGGNVESITDGKETFKMWDFLTPEEVYTFFTDGKALLDKIPETQNERMQGMTSKSIYRQLVVLSNILEKIIGEEKEEEEEESTDG